MISFKKSANFEPRITGNCLAEFLDRGFNSYISVCYVLINVEELLLIIFVSGIKDDFDENSPGHCSLWRGTDK